MKCAICGEQVPDGARFCESCGTPVAAKPRCVKCGAELAPGDVFCGECGAGQRAPSVSPPPRPDPAPPAPRPASQPRGKRGGGSWLPLVAGVVVGLAALAGGVFLLQGQASKSAAPSPQPPATAPAATQAAAGGQPVSLAVGSPQPAPSATALRALPTQVPPTPRPPTTPTAAATPPGLAPTLDPRATAAAEATAQSAATAQAVAAEAAATAQAATSAIDALARDATRLKEVLQGSLEPRDDGKPAASGWGVALRDFVAEGRFFNPHDSRERGWDYGLLFRSSSQLDGYRLTVHSDSEWVLELVEFDRGQYKVDTIDKGRVPGMELDADGSNVLKLVSGETVAYFLVNGHYVATLDVSRWTGSGDVMVVAGAFPRHTIPGRPTRFAGFDLYSLR